jgi:hypothetical protein
VRRPFCLVAVISSLLIAAACGSSGGTTSSPTDNNALSADQLADKAFAALSAATSFHTWGTTLAASGATVHFDMHLGMTGGYGTVRAHGQTIQIRTVDERTYLRGPDAYYRKLVPADKRATVLPLLHGKWLHVPQGSKQFFAFARLTSIEVFRTHLPASASGGSYKSGGPKMVRGMAAASFIDQSGGNFIYVAETGRPYPLEITSGPYNKTEFGSWNKPVTVSEPPARQIVEPSQLLGR